MITSIRPEETAARTAHLLSAGLPKSDARASQRLVQLDVLRGLAILLVLLAHQVYIPKEPGIFRDFTICLHQFGLSGVDLFFVLSGFLIGGLLLREVKITGRLDVRRFLIRRGFKIWPAYYVFLCVAFVQLIRHKQLSINSASSYVPFLFNLQNYIGPFDLNIHTWSLAVEEHFYLALPILLWCLLKLRQKKLVKLSLPISILAIMVFCNVCRLFNGAHRSFLITDYTATHLRMDALFWGVLISYAYQHKQDLIQRISRHKVLLITVGCSLVSFKFFQERDAWFAFTLGYTALYFGYGLILLAFLELESNSWLMKLVQSGPAKALAFMGLYSYSIYLWHLEFAAPFVIAKILPVLPEGLKWPLGMTIYVILATISGVIGARIIEIPVLAIREKLFPSMV